jgi:transcriptional regulator with XRE-family HTH domain
MSTKSPNPIDKHVGARIRMRRLQISMSQEKLGDALGLTFQQVQKYEKGTNRVGASRLQHIATILQVPISFFFQGLPTNAGEKRGSHGPDLLTELMSSSDGMALAKAFTRIGNSKLRRSLVDFVEQIAPEHGGR